VLLEHLNQYLLRCAEHRIGTITKSSRLPRRTCQPVPLGCQLTQLKQNETNSNARTLRRVSLYMDLDAEANCTVCKGQCQYVSQFLNKHCGSRIARAQQRASCAATTERRLEQSPEGVWQRNQLNASCLSVPSPAVVVKPVSFFLERVHLNSQLLRSHEHTQKACSCTLCYLQGVFLLRSGYSALYTNPDLADELSLDPNK
jgi:hypothetical protein